MEKGIFKQYSDIKNELKDLTARAKVIETQVFDEMTMNEADTVKSDFGTFSITTRKSWTYSEKLADRETDEAINYQESIQEQKASYDKVVAEIDEAKTVEQEDGSATAEETKGLRYLPKKEVKEE